MKLSLEGKTALVCGSSQGIGEAIARQLAEMGARCILLARNAEKLEQVAGRLAGNGHSYYAVDMSHEDDLLSLATKIAAEQPVHILINNSGGPAAGPIASAAEEDFKNAFQQHIIAAHILTKVFVDGMKQSGYGRIVNIISTSVKIPLKNLGVSNTIRGAMASWAKTMANELGAHQITVNNVLPGFTTTERLEKLVANMAQKRAQDVSSVEQHLMDEVPLKRFGKPEEVAAVAAFLASPAASYVNGVSIPVDGGRTGSI